MQIGCICSFELDRNCPRMIQTRNPRDNIRCLLLSALRVMNIIMYTKYCSTDPSDLGWFNLLYCAHRTWLTSTMLLYHCHEGKIDDGDSDVGHGDV